MTNPTPNQIENCYFLGWQYVGDGLFQKGERWGWFKGLHWVEGD